MNKFRYSLIALIGLSAVTGSVMAGCNKSDDSASNSTPGAPPTAAQTTQNVQKVQNDANIPPEAKAHIIASMQNHGRPGQTSSAPAGPK